MTPDPLTYANAGVDIDAGHEVVRQLAPLVRRTHGPRVLGAFGGFAAAFRLDFNEKLFKRNYREPVLLACTDGVGSKIQLAVRMGVYDTVGQDVVAMNVNDLIVQGAEPLFFLDYLGIHADRPDRVAEIVKGVARGCELADCALIGGETASLPDTYRPDDFDLVGFCVGVCELKKMVTGKRVEAGDVVLGVGSSGVHSNGFTLVRAVLDKHKLDPGKAYDDLESDRPLGRVLLEPTLIYARQVMRVLRYYRVKQPVHAMAHITGGGLGANLERSLPAHVDARIDPGAWERPAVFGFLARHGPIEEQEMWRVFNMGIGFVMIVSPHFADAIAYRMTRMGMPTGPIGRVTAGTGRVVLGP